jgi:hypothetical protein
MLVQVENETLVRDTKSNAILEVDKKKLYRHRDLKKSMLKKEKLIDDLVERINKLEQMIIKSEK